MKRRSFIASLLAAPAAAKAIALAKPAKAIQPLRENQVVGIRITSADGKQAGVYSLRPDGSFEFTPAPPS